MAGRKCVCWPARDCRRPTIQEVVSFSRIQWQVDFWHWKNHAPGLHASTGAGNLPTHSPVTTACSSEPPFRAIDTRLAPIAQVLSFGRRALTKGKRGAEARCRPRRLFGREARRAERAHAPLPPPGGPPPCAPGFPRPRTRRGGAAAAAAVAWRRRFQLSSRCSNGSLRSALRAAAGCAARGRAAAAAGQTALAGSARGSGPVLVGGDGGRACPGPPAAAGGANSMHFFFSLSPLFSPRPCWWELPSSILVKKRCWPARRAVPAPGRVGASSLSVRAKNAGMRRPAGTTRRRQPATTATAAAGSRR